MNFLTAEKYASLHISMARISVQMVSRYVCVKQFHFLPSTVCGQRLNAFAGVQNPVDVAVSQAVYVPSSHVLLFARRNYKTTRKSSHLTVEEQFILRVSGVSF